MSDGRTRIIECAFRLFLERGYEGTSLNDLVKACGLSKGALYHHFADKDALHDATIDYFFGRFFPHDAPPSEEASPEQIVSEMGEGLIALIGEISRITPDIAAYYRFVLSILPKVRQSTAHQLSAAQTRLARAIERAQAQGTIAAPLPPEALAFHCLASIEGAAFLCAVTGEEDMAAKVRATIGDLRQMLGNMR